MTNIIGLLIIVTGFCLPYFTTTRLPSIYFFWLGGLLSLNKGIIIRGDLWWPKWAQIGILINVVFEVINLVTILTIGEGSISRFEYWFSMSLYWVSSPATAIGQQLFPYPETHQLDGSVCFQISHSRTVITAFLNVATFALMSALFGIFWQKRKVKKISSEQINRGDRE